MERIFLSVFLLSLSGTAVILLVLVIKMLFGEKLTPGFHVLIWFLAFFALIVPLRVSLPFARPLPEITQRQERKSLSLPFHLELEFEESLSNQKSLKLPSSDTRQEANKTNLAVWPLWTVGMTVYLVRRLIGAAKMKHSLLSHAMEPSETDRMLFDQQCSRLNLTGVSLCRSGLTPTPLVFGLLRPRVYLPEAMDQPEEIALSLRHELVHCKEGHLWMKAAAQIIAGIHWFNPLCRMMCRDIDESCELYCDSKVIQDLPEGDRVLYGKLLLKTAAHTQLACPSSLSLSGKETLKRRLICIMNGHPSRRLLSACFAILLSCTATVCAAAAGTFLPDQETIKSSGSQPGAAAETQEAAGEETPNAGDIGTPELSQEELEEELKMMKLSLLQKKDIEEYQKRDYLGGQMAWPVPGFTEISKEFGWQAGEDDFVTGINIGKEKDVAIDGAEIVAANDGIVEKVEAFSYEQDRGYGNYLILNHGGGVTTLYAHCGTITVSLGQTVKKGQTIGTVGSTGFCDGPSLHFEVRTDGSAQNPRLYFDGRDEKEDLKQLNLIWPVDGGVVSDGFGEYTNHTGMDIAAPEGTNIYAAAGGTVVYAGSSRGYGNNVLLSHGGVKTRYAHCSQLYVKSGQQVKQGDLIASVGSTGSVTGAACHFEVTQGGNYLDPALSVGETCPQE